MSAEPLSPSNLIHCSHEGLVFNNVDGVGAVPNVENIAYLGFVAFIRPSVFLNLAPVVERNPSRLRHLVERGEPLGMPFLQVNLEEDPPRIHNHEGRHRMHAIMEVCGDVPMPVAILLRGGDRARHVTREHLERLSAGIYREEWEGMICPEFVEGPIFERVFLSGNDTAVSPEQSPQPRSF